MARGSETASNAATTAQTDSANLENNANQLYSTLAPTLESEVANPVGYNPADLSKMTTAAEQSAGGTQAGATGQGALLASRTKNPGTAAAAIVESARSAGQDLSQKALGIQTGNARLKEQQRQSGIAGLGGLNAEETGAGLSALGQVAPDVNANNQAINSSYDWATDILDPTLGALGSAAPTIGKAFGVGQTS
jgi:hypothetical protein